MKPTSVLLVTNIFPPIVGGSAVVYERLAANSNNRLMVLTARRNCDTGEALEIDHKMESLLPYKVRRINYLRPPERKTINLGKLYHLYSILIYLRLLLNILYTSWFMNVKHICIGDINSFGWIACTPRFLLNADVSIYTHGEELTRTLWSKAADRRRIRSLAGANKVFCVSTFTQGILKQKFSIPDTKIILLPNGVDIETFSPSLSNLQNLNQQNGKKYRLISVGRLVGRKGFDHAIEAMGIVSKILPNVQLDIVGEGPEYKNLAALISKYQLGGLVTLHGKVSMEKLIEFYRSSDLFLMPNRTMPDGDTEGFGLVFLEANACGLPVIGGRAGGAVDAIRDGRTGYLIDPENIEEIANRIHKLLTNEELRQQFSKNGLAFARENDWKTITNRFLDTLDCNL